MPCWGISGYRLTAEVRKRKQYMFKRSIKARQHTYQRGMVSCEKCLAPIHVFKVNVIASEFSARCKKCGHRGLYQKHSLKIDLLPERRKNTCAALWPTSGNDGGSFHRVTARARFCPSCLQRTPSPLPAPGGRYHQRWRAQPVFRSWPSLSRCRRVLARPSLPRHSR